MKNIALLLLGWILYLNYRLAYSVLIYRPVLTFRKFTEQPSDENTTQLIWVIIFDLFLVGWYMIGFWWTVLVCIGLILLNYAVYGVYKLIKK